MLEAMGTGELKWGVGTRSGGHGREESIEKPIGKIFSLPPWRDGTATQTTKTFKHIHTHTHESTNAHTHIHTCMDTHAHR